MDLIKMIVRSGWHERNGCPVQAKVALPSGVDLQQLSLWDLTGDAPVAVQAWPADDGQVNVTWVIASMRRNETRVYVLRSGDGAEPVKTQGVALAQKEPGKLEVSVGGEYLTTYHFGDVIRPYLYPVIAHGGMGVTRNWPMVADVPGEDHDHPHHKGIYTAQGEVNGVDNWGDGAKHGWIVHREFTRMFSGPVAAGFTESLDWTDPGRKTIMTETRRMLFYLTPAQARVLDYAIDFHASTGQVTMGDTKEGGLLSVRVASSMDVDAPGGGGRIENGYGAVSETETWGKQAPWCDYSGPRAGEWRGITLMDHPDNPRYPTYWHVRNYGLMTANPIGLHDFTADPNRRWDLVIPAGTSVGWRYRVLIHDGDARQASVAEHWHDFANPPQVEVAQGA